MKLTDWLSVIAILILIGFVEWHAIMAIPGMRNDMAKIEAKRTQMAEVAR